MILLTGGYDVFTMTLLSLYFDGTSHGSDVTFEKQSLRSSGYRKHYVAYRTICSDRQAVVERGAQVKNTINVLFPSFFQI